jgi:hypothetical protein
MCLEPETVDVFHDFVACHLFPFESSTSVVMKEKLLTMLAVISDTSNHYCLFSLFLIKICMLTKVWQISWILSFFRVDLPQ